MELSGGQFLTPVQKLVATLIFAEGKNANRVRPPVPLRSQNYSGIIGVWPLKTLLFDGILTLIEQLSTAKV